MTNLSEHIANFIGHYWSALVGSLIVAAYARQRFNEPTFPNREALPHTVAPLRYLFLRSTYQRARRTYILASLLLYGLLVLAGPQVASVFRIDDKSFPPEAWALLVALLLVGLLPTTSIKWITMIEEQLRRWVHEWFLVPDGVKKTIGVLEDAPYEPPASQLEAIPDAQRERLEADLKLKRGSLRYRWARATMLMATLNQMGAGAAHPLQKASFDPFAEDFDAIHARYKVLAQEIANLSKSASTEKEETLKRSVDTLLRRIYAYISWGVRQQADSDREMIQTLESIGFSISAVEGRALFDIVAPAVGLVACITMAFWLIHDAVSWTYPGIRWAIGAPPRDLSASVVSALISATAAAAMYGLAALIALKQRGAQIEQRVWRGASPKCQIMIGIRAGLAAWLVIVILTVYGDAFGSLAALLQLDMPTILSSNAGQPGVAVWIKIVSASSWFLAGATASAVLASRLTGDVRRTQKSDRVRDAAWLGVWLGLAVALAQLMQSALASALQGKDGMTLSDVPLVAFVGVVCGVIIGFMVPYACKENLATPPDPVMARQLRNLLREAKTTLGTAALAENWVFSPQNGLHGITPAEAIQYEGYAYVVRTLLNSEASREREETWPDRGNRPMPLVIDGGRSA
jgi:hypothetical protein